MPTINTSTTTTTTTSSSTSPPATTIAATTIFDSNEIRRDLISGAISFGNISVYFSNKKYWDKLQSIYKLFYPKIKNPIEDEVRKFVRALLSMRLIKNLEQK